MRPGQLRCFPGNSCPGVMKNGFSDYYKFSNVGADNDCLTADVPCTGEHDCGVVKRVVGTIVDDGFVDDLGECIMRQSDYVIERNALLVRSDISPRVKNLVWAQTKCTEIIDTTHPRVTEIGSS